MVTVEKTRQILEETGFHHIYTDDRGGDRPWHYQIELGKYLNLNVSFVEEQSHYDEVTSSINIRGIYSHPHLALPLKRFDKLIMTAGFKPAILIRYVFFLMEEGKVDFCTFGSGCSKTVAGPSRGFGVRGMRRLPKLTHSILKEDKKLKPLIVTSDYDDESLKSLLAYTKSRFTTGVKDVEDKLNQFIGSFKEMDELLKNLGNV